MKFLNIISSLGSGRKQAHSLEDATSFEGLSSSQAHPSDYLCFSHLRWDFVFQRPQHLLSRLGQRSRVFYFEEPIFEEVETPIYRTFERENGKVRIVVPVLPLATKGNDSVRLQQELVDDFISDHEISDFGVWYYTPMAMAFTAHLRPQLVIYDCMDELSHFKGAPLEMQTFEAQLLDIADVVFTGGYSLYEFKKDRHPNIHPFPSSIDFDHFYSSRKMRKEGFEPGDQKSIPYPRLGFYGVVDERMNLSLLQEAADFRPDWHFVIIGPVVKIDPASLPKRANIHYLGGKKYSELPSYLAGWDVAFLPFAKNESTKFISPTKTPEYLAAGCPVVSTSIRDVVRPYAIKGLIKIADTPQEFIRQAEVAMMEADSNPQFLENIDRFLSSNSWDQTFDRMEKLALEALKTEDFQAPIDLQLSRMDPNQSRIGRG